MSGIRKMKIGGEIVDATPVPVSQSDEPWNSYILDDGTMLKARFIVTRIFRIEGRYTNEGEPLYSVNHHTILSTDAPESLRADLGEIDDETPPQG